MIGSIEYGHRHTHTPLIHLFAQIIQMCMQIHIIWGNSMCRYLSALMLSTNYKLNISATKFSQRHCERSIKYNHWPFHSNFKHWKLKSIHWTLFQSVADHISNGHKYNVCLAIVWIFVWIHLITMDIIYRHMGNEHQHHSKYYYFDQPFYLPHW